MGAALHLGDSFPFFDERVQVGNVESTGTPDFQAWKFIPQNHVADGPARNAQVFGGLRLGQQSFLGDFHNDIQMNEQAR